MSHTRRSFLRSLGLSAGAFALGSVALPRRAAAVSADRRFIFCYMSGGWDGLLGLDPRDPNVFTEERIGETKIQLGWDRLDARYRGIGVVAPAGSNLELGPTTTRIAAHFDKLCVVRGISTDTVAHEVGRRYFLTGLPPRGTSAAGSSVGTRVVAQQGDLSTIPHLVSRVETYNEGDPSFASGMSINGYSDLVAALQDGPGAPTGVVRSALDGYRARATKCDPARLNDRGILTLLSDTQTKARDLVESGVATLFDFSNTRDADMTAIRARYGIVGNSGNQPGAQAAVAFQALKHRVAQVVTLELANGLDTHDDSWATTHPAALEAGFDALAQLVTDLSTEPHELGGTLLDRTTIVVFSEFGRTSLLNSRDGRDHSLSTSCLLIGAGVPHNRVVGATSDVGMGPVAIDPVTGNVAATGGVILTPTLIHASILQAGGFDTSRLRTSGVPALMG
ncbi:MAG: DUF1501 domain-containing protein [Deltaproteobacteria bacterium]|nr:DUF1501 domain-containing protein [Deltaproteobacteria bacterium]